MRPSIPEQWRIQQVDLSLANLSQESLYAGDEVNKLAVQVAGLQNVRAVKVANVCNGKSGTS